jgi:hypothetical protein
MKEKRSARVRKCADEIRGTVSGVVPWTWSCIGRKGALSARDGLSFEKG